MFDDRDQQVEAVPDVPAPLDPTVIQPVVEPVQPLSPAPVETISPPTFVPPTSTSVTTPPQSAPAPNASGDQVWISKEEYQRLQQAQMAADHSPVATTKPAKLISGVQIAAAATAAVALIIGLVSQSSFFSFLIVPSLIVLVLMGAFTLRDYANSKKPNAVLKPHKARNGILLAIAIIVLALPVILPIGFVLLLMITCAGGGCKGS
jgi:hypothetical protein